APRVLPLVVEARRDRELVAELVVVARVGDERPEVRVDRARLDGAIAIMAAEPVVVEQDTWRQALLAQCWVDERRAVGGGVRRREGRAREGRVGRVAAIALADEARDGE